MTAPVGYVTRLSTNLGGGIGPEDKGAYIAKLEGLLAGQRMKGEELNQQVESMRVEKEALDAKKRRLESQYEMVAERLASVTTGEANPAHEVLPHSHMEKSKVTTPLGIYHAW